MNSKEFSLTIEGVVKEKKISHMDAVVWYCDENGLDTGQVSSLISKSLKEKIEVEAVRLHMTIISMVVRSIQNLTHLLKGKTDTFFTN